MLYIIASIIILGFVSAWLDKRYKRKLKQKIESGEIQNRNLRKQMIPNVAECTKFAKKKVYLLQ